MSLSRSSNRSPIELSEENLSLVKAALHYQHAQTDADKKYWQQELADRIRFYCINGVRPLFINLAGINISGADLMDTPKDDKGRRTCPHLNFADLSGAILDGCNMFAFDIKFSNLTGASLRNVFGDRCGERYGPRIFASLAKKACFDGIELVVGSCEKTDFTGASFKEARFQEMSLSGSVFDGANFEGATVDRLRDTRDASFKNASFLNAELQRICL